MNQMSIRPDLLTFNSVLKVLRRCGYLSRTYAPQILNEMKALGIGDDELVVLARSQINECFKSVSSHPCVQLPAWPPTTTSWPSFTKQVHLVLTVDPTGAELLDDLFVLSRLL